MRSQCHRIIDYLATGKPLTALEALRRFGSFRLAARVAELKERGHRIQVRRVGMGDKYVAQYRLDPVEISHIIGRELGKGKLAK